MQSHPIPQNVVSFEDRIFGPLTAKQFSVIGTGLSFAFVLFLSPLPSIVKMPAIGIIVLFSFIAGLAKKDGMSLDKWTITFLTAIYSPTQFTWQKETDNQFLKFLDYAKELPKEKDPKEKKLPQPRTLDSNYLQEDEEDTIEQEFINNLNFNIPVPNNLISPQQTTEPIETTATPSPTPNIPSPTQKTQIKQVSTPQPQIDKTPQEDKIKGKERLLEKTQPKQKPIPLQTLNPTPIVPKQKEIERKPSLPQPVSNTKEHLSPESKKKPATIPLTSTKATKQPSETPTTHPKKAIASKVDSSPKHTYAVNIGGQSDNIVQGRSNLKINRAIRKNTLDQHQQVFPTIKGQKKLEVSPELSNRFKTNDLDLDIHKLEILQINNTEAVPHISQTSSQPVPIQKKETAKQIIKTPSIKTTPKKSAKIKENPEKERKPMMDRNQEETKLVSVPISETINNTPQITSTPPKEVQPIVSPSPKTPFLPQKPTFSPPKIPNVITGITQNANETILSNVIAIIKDATESPVRALKSNRLGQFSIATPLQDGRYTIEFEKEGCQFDRISLELKGEILPTLRIKSKT